jgi:hypothetical protein
MMVRSSDDSGAGFPRLDRVQANTIPIVSNIKKKSVMVRREKWRRSAPQGNNSLTGDGDFPTFLVAYFFWL